MFRKIVGLSILGVVGMVSITSAQEQKAQKPTVSTVAKVGKLDSKTSDTSVRASKLIGMKILNSKQEHVGQISDIVLDPVNGRIQYVAVTYGGFLGVGDKLFAVPMQAISVQRDVDRADRVVLVLDVTPEQLNGAMGFDEEHWPNFTDSAFKEDLHKRYGVTDRWNEELNRENKQDVKTAKAAIGAEIPAVKK